MITRSLAFLVIGLGALEAGSAFGQSSASLNSASPTPPLPPIPAPLVGSPNSPGVKTNRTQLFSSTPIQPRFVPPTLGVPPVPRTVTPVPPGNYVGRPAPLADPPRSVAPPPTY